VVVVEGDFAGFCREVIWPGPIYGRREQLAVDIHCPSFFSFFFFFFPYLPADCSGRGRMPCGSE